MNQRSALEAFLSVFVSSHAGTGGVVKPPLLVLNSDNNTTLHSCVCPLAFARRQIDRLSSLGHMLNNDYSNTSDAIASMFARFQLRVSGKNLVLCVKTQVCHTLLFLLFDL